MFARFASDKSGAIGIIFGLALLPVVGLTGAAIDYTRATGVRAEMQSAMDAAVLVGASAPSGTGSAAATKVFNSTFKSTSGILTGPSFSTGSDGSFTGSASLKNPNVFLSILGMSTTTVGVTASAKPGTSSGDSDAGRVCILLLATNQNQALLVNSGPNITAPKCQIDVKSTASPAAIFNSGAKLNFSKICVAGTSVIQNGGAVPNLETGCKTASDPFASKLPAPPAGSDNCTYNNLNYNGGNVALKPGTYCGWVNFNGSSNVTFAPGVYVIKNGGWNVNGGTWTGTDVTFYFADSSKIQFNSAVTSTLKAPTTGTYKDFLFYEKAGLSNSDFILNDSKGQDFSGIIYLPSRNVTYNSSSMVTGEKITMVFRSLILNQTTWSLEPGTHAIPAAGSSTTTTAGPAYLTR